MRGLQDIKSDPDIWIAITGETKGQILRLEASLKLEITGDIETAGRLADEAKIIDPNADDSRIRALIALKEDGPASALDLVTARSPDSAG